MIEKILLPIAIGGAFVYMCAQPQPEVWLGDVSNSCIIIVHPDGTEEECPEDKSELVNYTPVYVMEDL